MAATALGARASEGLAEVGWGLQSKNGSIMAHVSHRVAAISAACFSLAISTSSQSALASSSVVPFAGYSAGTIVVHTGERRLYLVMGDGSAIRYPVGVGKAGRQWSGASRIDGKYISPAWSPPSVIRHEKPWLPSVIPGGSKSNPMGVAAMTLAGGEYAIHGTNQPGSIGGFVSYGCIRMLNADITDLFGRVAVGTPVVVTR
jgi:lipoprotein-anchoring transpeptidase ErfK/SrfK